MDTISSGAHSRKRKREIQEDRYGFKLTPSMAQEFEAFASNTGRTLTDVIVSGLQKEMAPKPDASTGTNAFRAPYVASVPCGPWAEAIDLGGSVVIHEDTADELEVRDGDFWFRADGQSMEGKGILDSDLVIFRRYENGKAPQRGDIVLVEAVTEDGDHFSTLKEWNGLDSNGLPRLLDGDDQPFAFPAGTAHPRPFARAVGRLGRL